VGDVPQNLLDDVLAVCSPEQLLRIEAESNRPDLNTDKFWQLHCGRIGISKVPGKNWKETYKHKLADDEVKRQRVAQRIREMSQQETKERETKRSRVLEALPANKKARTVSYPGARANNNFNQIKNRPNPAAVKVAPKAGMNLLQLSKLQAKKKKGHL
jgi:hypothetical protein